MRSVGWFVAACLAVSGICLAPLRAQAPLQARLAAPLESRRALVGAPVVASVMVPWATAGCTLKAGSTVTGHVTAVQSLKQSQREASLALSFDKADCNGLHEVPISLLLVAVVRVEEPEAERQASYYPGLFSTGNGGPHGGAAHSAGVYVGVGVTTGGGPARKGPSGPASIESGQVIGLKRLELGVGTGPGGASVLFSSSRDFSLDTHVELVLTAQAPSADGHTEVAEARRNETALPLAVPPPPPPPDISEICAARDCNVADLAGEPLAAGAALAAPLGRFGYSLRTYLRQNFDQDTTVSYLSPQQVLVTFDTHRLRSRSPGVWPERERRPLRAVLLNAQTSAVERVVDWTVDGAGPYLWPAGTGRVAVHMGGALQVLGPDLEPTVRVPVEGDLHWVASSPSGDEIAFALLRERHTRETHAFLRNQTGLEPQEDTEVRLIDRSGAVRLVRPATSEMKPPILTDGGREIVVRPERHGRWQLREQTESSGKDARTVATVNSGCEPEVTALFEDALFVVGCNQTNRWYRVIRSSGKTLLLGRDSPVQIEPGAIGSEAGVYAVRVVRTKQPLGGMSFRTKDLNDEQVGVYRMEDGKRILLARTDSFPEASRNFALSPDGHQLALLTRSEVRFYGVDGQPHTAANPLPAAGR